jgi:hypothetical protein
MLKSIPCHTDEELQQLLAGDRKSLQELAPYNGTAPGARAIASTRHHMEMVEREIARRGEHVHTFQTITSENGPECTGCGAYRHSQTS